jgi:hypothetical protein
VNQGDPILSPKLLNIKNPKIQNLNPNPKMEDESAPVIQP